MKKFIFFFLLSFSSFLFFACNPKTDCYGGYAISDDFTFYEKAEINSAFEDWNRYVGRKVYEERPHLKGSGVCEIHKVDAAFTVQWNKDHDEDGPWIGKH